jgi:peptide/nickel transport system permease protein/oligopeptide transport system permease protein
MTEQLSPAVTPAAGPAAEALELEPTTNPDAPLQKATGLWGDAWRQLIRDKVFVISALYILVITSMALFPALWTNADPRDCNVSNARLPPSSEHWFGTNVVGCDYYAHAIYGARPSMSIALLSTIGVTLLGGVLGMLAGYHGRWIDTLISRMIDIFLALPFLLGAIVFLTVIKIYNVWTISAVLIILSWTIIARIMRGSVLASRNLDYVHAARSLGARNRRLMTRHVLPNALAPVVVYATIIFGGFVAAEATLSFLGVGLRPPAISWGVMISQHEAYFLERPGLLLFPGGLLFFTVLAFILMGDALRDALDPKLR